MRFLKILGMSFVAMIFFAAFGIWVSQFEPATARNYQTAAISDKRFTGVSVATGVPNEAEIQVVLPDGRQVWLPGLRYYLDNSSKKACLVTLKARYTELVRYKAVAKDKCNA